MLSNSPPDVSFAEAGPKVMLPVPGAFAVRLKLKKSPPTTMCCPEGIVNVESNEASAALENEAPRKLLVASGTIGPAVIFVGMAKIDWLKSISEVNKLRAGPPPKPRFTWTVIDWPTFRLLRLTGLEVNVRLGAA